MILGAAPDHFVLSAMSNTAKATALALGRLDDRFTVDAGFANGVSRYTLSVKEDIQEIPFSIEVPADSEKPWIEGLQSLQDHAREVSLPMKGASFAGSALLSKLMAGMGGNLVLAPHGRRASVHLTMRPGTPDSWQFDDIRGKIFVGQKTAQFEGTACNEMLTLQLTLPSTHETSSSCSVNLGISFHTWEGRPVTALPFAERLLRLAEELMHEAPLKLEIDISGKRISSIGPSRFPDGRESFGQLAGCLLYADLAAKLSLWLNLPIAFRACSISRSDFARLAQAVAWADREVFVAGDLSDDPVARMDQETAEAMGKQDWTKARLEFPTAPVSVYGTEVQLPNLIVDLEDVRLKVVPGVRALGDVEVAFERGVKFRLVCWLPNSTNVASRSRHD